MEKIINEKHDLYQLTNADVVLGPTQRVTRVEIIIATKKMRLGKAAGPSEINTEMIVASSRIELEVMMKLCQRVVKKWRRNSR